MSHFKQSFPQTVNTWGRGYSGKLGLHKTRQWKNNNFIISFLCNYDMTRQFFRLGALHKYLHHPRKTHYAFCYRQIILDMFEICVYSEMRNISADFSIFVLPCSCDSSRRVDRSQTSPSTWNVATHSCNDTFYRYLHILIFTSKSQHHQSCSFSTGGSAVQVSEEERRWWRVSGWAGDPWARADWRTRTTELGTPWNRIEEMLDSINYPYFFVDNIQWENTKTVKLLLPGSGAHRVKSAAVIEENIYQKLIRITNRINVTVAYISTYC